MKSSLPQHSYRSSSYEVHWDPSEPLWLDIKGGGKKTRVPVVGGVHGPDKWDGLGRPEFVSAVSLDEAEVWTFEAASETWEKFQTVWVLEADSTRVHHEIVGTGSVDVVSFFETVPVENLPDAGATLPLVRRVRPPLRTYSVSSPYFHRSVYVPQPYAGQGPERPADTESLLTVAGTFGPIDFNTWFSPGLFCFGLMPATGRKWFLGLGTGLGGHLYNSFRYVGGNGGWGTVVDYDGMLKVKGHWISPDVEIRWASDIDTGLREHVASGRNRGWFPEPAPAPAAEWRRPIFCGWGQQQVFTRETGKKAKLAFLELQVSPSATALATEDAYREMVRLLEKEKLPFGTVTLDLAWGTTPGIPIHDPKKWPDLKGFIAEQHAKGRKVLLWLGCWSTQNLPESMLMKAEKGCKPLPDPTLPAFRNALGKAIHEAISPEGLNADGFKLDFSGDVPRGRGYRPHKALWGVELLRDYVLFIYKSLKKAKSSAILQTHCANPLFADCTNILRLNDIFEDRIDIRECMAQRARMARIANENWLIDTDNDPFISAKAWWEYMEFQPEIGIPSLMTVTHMCRSTEPVPKGAYKRLNKIWRDYLKREGL